MFEFEAVISHEETEPFDDGIGLPEQFLVRPLMGEQDVYLPHACVKRLDERVFHFGEVVEAVDIDDRILERSDCLARVEEVYELAGQVQILYLELPCPH